MLLLFPSDVLAPRRVDEHFAAEADAARALEIPIALVDHDTLNSPGDARGAVARVPAGVDAVYRGWMLSAARYSAFADALRERDVCLRTDARRYRRAHELPGWYPALSTVTPDSVWTEDAGRAAFDQARERLGPGPAVLRDFTKSMKHHWHEAAFIPDLADAAAAWAVACRFRDLRAEDFTGGFVLRRFERFGSPELRTWWRDGTCRLAGPHPDTPDTLPAAEFDLTAIQPLIAGLALPFVTADLVLRADGVVRVVELGDGQVSDRPATIDPHRFVALLR